MAARQGLTLGLGVGWGVPRGLSAACSRSMTSLSDAVTMFLDGKVADARIIHKKLNGPAHCVGEDAQGNKYYEIKKGVTYGRHRWVDFANIHDYSPASIPPEWHGWLHNVTDDEPNTVSTHVSPFLK